MTLNRSRTQNIVAKYYPDLGSQFKYILIDYYITKVLILSM